MTTILVFLFGVAIGAVLSSAIRHTVDWANRPTVYGSENEIELWHRGKSIELSPAAARRLADHLVKRAEEIEGRGG